MEAPRAPDVDISWDIQKMPIRLHRKAFEPPLLQMPPATRVVMLVMASHMRHAHPPINPPSASSSRGRNTGCQ